MEPTKESPDKLKPSVIIQQKSSSIPIAIVALSVIALLGIVLVIAGFFVLAVITNPKESSDSDMETTFVTGDSASSHRAAIISIEGFIYEVEESSLFFSGTNTVSAIRKRLKKAARDKVKAIILDVNSPGGGVHASDTIYREIVKFKKNHPDIPIIAHFKDLAASGGYYVSAPADWIVASPSTLTGSIGVILMHRNLKGLTEEKLGIKSRAFISGAQKDILSPYRDMTKPEEDHIQSIVDELYDQFVNIVVEGRKGRITEEQVRALECTVLTGTQAKEKGLVDHLGTLDDAVAKATELARVESLKVVRYSPPRSLLQELVKVRFDTRVQVGPTSGLEPHLNRGGSPFLYLWRL